MEAMYGRLLVNVKVEPRSTLTFTLTIDIHYLSLIYAHKIYVRAHVKITQ